MAEHLFRGSFRTFTEIVELSGIKRTTLAGIKYRYPEKSYDQIFAEYKKPYVIWAKIARAIGISDGMLQDRVKKHGLEATLLMSPEKRSTHPASRVIAGKMAGTMTNPDLPVFDKDYHLKQLIASLEGMGLTEANLEHEAMRRARDY